MSFPKDFLWGAATAAPQIEGGWNEGGRTASIWDVAPDGKIDGGDTCHIACDHYHLWREDVKLMKKLGLKAYRFSVSWSRIMPEEGKINPEGIRFYSELVDELLGNGIEPLVTIYHWDLPVWVHEKGGWTSENIVPLFADYTKAVVDALSDRVAYWMPLNEPQCFINFGYITGTNAPFEKHDASALTELTRNCLMAFHASAEVIRQYAKREPKIGIAMATGAYIPENDSAEAIKNAECRSFCEGIGLERNGWWYDPLIKGESVGMDGVCGIAQEDMPKIKTKLDFVGINVYKPFNTREHEESLPAERRTTMGWEIDGRCLYWTIRFVYDRYGLPVMVTENGMSNDDAISADGQVHDEKRVGYIREYLENVKRACDEGYPVTGYLYWSLLDNFEWAKGYKPRFGIVHMNYETMERTPKDSTLFYRKVIETNGECL